MQTVLHVSCTGTGSLRDTITSDGKNLARFDLEVSESRRTGRQNGWAKLHSTRPDRAGAVNVHWDKNARLLVCRVVTKGGDPAAITGDFTAYLLARHRRRIHALTVIPEV